MSDYELGMFAYIIRERRSLAQIIAMSDYYNRSPIEQKEALWAFAELSRRQLATLKNGRP